VSYLLRREEVVDVAGLQAMLEETPGKAAQAILAAAGQGAVEAQLLLGQILLDGRGIQQDATVARRWFGIAAQGGSAMAHNMLGRCLEHGWGGEVSLVQAAVHYARAADSGLDWGLYNLGNLLATGRGVPANQAQALMCYEKAAQLGHAKSMNLYGRYLEQGIATAPSPARRGRCAGIGVRPRRGIFVGCSAWRWCWSNVARWRRPRLGWSGRGSRAT